jgi:hypothetical protein
MPMLIALYILWGVLFRTSLAIPEAKAPEDTLDHQD